MISKCEHPGLSAWALNPMTSDFIINTEKRGERDVFIEQSGGVCENFTLKAIVTTWALLSVKHGTTAKSREEE